jgi:hypothetical protein
VESVAKGSSKLEDLHKLTRKHASIADELGTVLASREGELHRHHEAVGIRRLRARTLGDVEQIRAMERAGASGHSVAGAIGGLGALAIGGAVSAASGRGRPKKIGARVASQMLSRKVPFGNVMVVVGPEGIPNDVKVVSISKLARESGRGEAAVMDDLRASGHRLMTPSTLVKVLDKRERELLNGSTASPVRIRRKP